jgi:hypothetical protein
MSNLIKNEDGSYTYGEFVVLAPVYDQSTKKHIFNILRNGCVPIRHDGNFLTLKNSIKRLTDGVVPSERTEVFSLGELLADETTPVEAVETAPEAPETTERETTDPLLLALRKLVASKSDEDYAIFKTLLDEEVQSFS